MHNEYLDKPIFGYSLASSLNRVVLSLVVTPTKVRGVEIIIFLDFGGVDVRAAAYGDGNASFLSIFVRLIVLKMALLLIMWAFYRAGNGRSSPTSRRTPSLLILCRTCCLFFLMSLWWLWWRFSGRGTEIVLHLKEDAGEFLSESSLTSLIHRYSEFITFPIFQLVEKEEEVEVDDEEEDEDEAEAAGESCIEFFVVETVGREYVIYGRPVYLSWPGPLLAYYYSSFSVAHAGNSVVLGASRPFWP